MEQNTFLKLLGTMVYFLELLSNYYIIFTEITLRKNIKENANV